MKVARATTQDLETALDMQGLLDEARLWPPVGLGPTCRPAWLCGRGFQGFDLRGPTHTPVALFFGGSATPSE
jgi:hypothetical protein